MHRWVIEDLVLGQPVPTTSASARRQLCGTVTYSRSRPRAVTRGDLMDFRFAAVAALGISEIGAQKRTFSDPNEPRAAAHADAIQLWRLVEICSSL